MIKKLNIIYLNKLLKYRFFNINLFFFNKINNKRKILQFYLNNLRKNKNILSKKYFLNKKNNNFIYKNILYINNNIKKIKNILNIFNYIINHFILSIPNIPHKSISINKYYINNIIIKKTKKKKFNFKIKNHINIGKKMGISNTDGIKITGSNFFVIKNKLAKLYRAIYNFMIDFHLKKNNYIEYQIPYITNKLSLIGSGQFPKFKNKIFKIKNNNEKKSFYLIPTSEVALINIMRNNIISFNKLPIKMLSYSHCFRNEKISYGIKNKGLIRQYQFDKIELVQFVEPKYSQVTLEKMLFHAENILKKIDLPYRIIELCSGEINFSSCKTYDLEVWLPSEKIYIEVSSISNCKDFQTKRINAKFINKNENIKFLNSLNATGLAIGRIFISILENYQMENEKIFIPKVLRKYMNNIKKI
ncbi:seryl-tRNA synthetase [Candidatus Zinderia insecticola CARI]|uniref:Serine--tRNA ligase n=1 Tax=Zinderia insecticola (strain CARI) TaxID=871271 RepID=E0TIQ2_ZINIC|nr:seryl-tRNA synthetase [Candidatus Zinderia insecticola CARI]